MLTEEDIINNRERFISLLESTNREGIKDVIEYLDKNDFFILPSSLTRHHNWRGGLTQHCLGVYDRLLQTGQNLPKDSSIIVSLLHDVCKVGKMNYDENGDLKIKEEAEIDYPGHGNRSIKLLEEVCKFPLTEDERRAIRWHMGGYNIDRSEIRDFFATKKSDLWRLLMNADRFDARHNGA